MLCSWSRIWWLPGIGHVECGLLNERWWIHAPADEEASSTTEQHTHHQQEPKIPQPLYGEGPHTAPGATAVFIGTASPLAALAAALPLCRAGGPWLRRRPPEAGLHSPGRAGGLRGYERTPAEGRAASRQSWRTCQATLAARSRPTSRARARGLGALKVCGARCGTRRQRGWVRRRLGASSPRGDHLVSPRQFWEGY